MRIAYLIGVLLVAILAVVFAVQNGAEVAVTFFSWSATGSLSLFLILALSIGIVLGLLVMAPSAFKRSFQFSGLKRRLSKTEKEKLELSQKVEAAKDPAPSDKETPTAP